MEIAEPPASATPAAKTGRPRRPLRCGDPTIHPFRTDDGVDLRLTRFQGGSRGPVILAPGFGTSALAYTIDTVDTNLPEFLYERGYDVWVLDYRSSPALPSAETHYTLDDIATRDWPAAVQAVRDIAGVDSVQVIAHCVGSVTFLMALAAGLGGVRSGVASQYTLHPRGVALMRLRTTMRLGRLMNIFGLETLTTDVTPDAGLGERLFDSLLAYYPAGREKCKSKFCRRALFIYGEVYDHDQLNEATHDALHEMFGIANITPLNQVSLSLTEGIMTDAEGHDVYLANADRLKLPLMFLQGEHNRLFTPDGCEETYRFLCNRNGSEHYVHHVVPGYAHMDCFIGKNAARDVFPAVTEHLDRFNPA